MYSDNFWHLATAGRVYPKAKRTATVDPEALAEAIREVRDRLDTAALWHSNRAKALALLSESLS